MKKTILIGVVLAVVAAACGDAAEDAVGASPAAGAESEFDAEPVGESAPVDETATAPDPSETTIPPNDPVLEVAPVEPDKGGVQPPPTAAAGDQPASPPTVDLADPQIGSSVADLADRVGAQAGDIRVAVDEAVTWRDGSLGCPQPGMSYTQALVSGRRIVLEHSGLSYAYHASSDGEPFYCAMPTEPLGDDELAPIDQ